MRGQLVANSEQARDVHVDIVRLSDAEGEAARRLEAAQLKLSTLLKTWRSPFSTPVVDKAYQFNSGEHVEITSDKPDQVVATETRADRSQKRYDYDAARQNSELTVTYFASDGTELPPEEQSETARYEALSWLLFGSDRIEMTG